MKRKRILNAISVPIIATLLVVIAVFYSIVTNEEYYHDQIDKVIISNSVQIVENTNLILNEIKSSLTTSSNEDKVIAVTLKVKNNKESSKTDFDFVDANNQTEILASFSLPHSKNLVIAPLHVTNSSEVKSYISSEIYYKNIFENIVDENQVMFIGKVGENSNAFHVGRNINHKQQYVTYGLIITLIITILISLRYFIRERMKRFSEEIQDRIKSKIDDIEEMSVPKNIKPSFTKMIDIENLFNNHHLFIKSLMSSEKGRRVNDIFNSIQKMIVHCLTEESSKNGKFSVIMKRMVFSEKKVKNLIENSSIFEDWLTEAVKEIHDGSLHVHDKITNDNYVDIIAIHKSPEKVNTIKIKESIDYQTSLLSGNFEIKTIVESLIFPDDGIYPGQLIGKITNKIESNYSIEQEIINNRKFAIESFFQSDKIDFTKIVFTFSQVVSTNDGMVKGLIASYSINLPEEMPFHQSEIDDFGHWKDKISEIESALISEACITSSIVNDIGKGEIFIGLSLSERSIRDGKIVERIRVEIERSRAKSNSIMIMVKDEVFNGASKTTESNISSMENIGVGIFIEDYFGNAIRSFHFMKHNIKYASIDVANICIRKSNITNKEITLLKGISELLNEVGIRPVYDNVNELKDIEVARLTSCSLLTGKIFGGSSSLFFAMQAIETGYQFAKIDSNISSINSPGKISIKERK